MSRISKPTILPIIPLANGSTVLPYAITKIPIPEGRSDITAIIGDAYTKAAARSVNRRLDAIPVALVPLTSRFIGPDGHLLLENGPRPDNVSGRDVDMEKLKRSDLFTYGVRANIIGVEGIGTGEFALRVEALTRVKLEKITQEEPFFEAKVKYFFDEVSLDDPEVQDLFTALKFKSRELVTVMRLSSLIPIQTQSSPPSPLLTRRLEAFIMKREVKDAGLFADFMANLVEGAYELKLQILAAFDVKERIEKVLELLEQQVGGLKGNLQVTTITTLPSDVLERLQYRQNRLPSNRNMPPMPGVTFIPPGSNMNMPIGGHDHEEEGNELVELKKKLDAAKLPPEASKVAERELKRLGKMIPANQDYQVTRTWLDTMAEIPWEAVTDDKLGPETLTRARKQLDDDHYGLEKVKKRLVEYLAVLRLKQFLNEDVEEQIKRLEQDTAALGANRAATSKQDIADAEREERTKASAAKLGVLKAGRMVDRPPIILLVGPPGVGKTSLAKSVATALGRKFHRISLGGIRDEAEIRGHRRTYVAAMPGLIIQGLRKVGVANPVFLLDEIDKLGMANHQGDPAAAMLEVLDPEQNHTFTDHYIGVHVDLSRVLFIATANSLETIPPALLDRMEMVYLPGYTTLEKRHIAMQHLIPKQVRVNGLSEDKITFNEEVVSKIIESYTRESGVRNLEREIGSVCRAKAVEFSEAKDGGHPETYRPQLTVQDIEDILGIEKFEEEIAEKTSRPGIVTGLVAYSSGGNGSILFIEVADMPGNGSVQLTGKLGSVLKESVEVALSWVKAHAYELGLTGDPTVNIMKERSIHVHCPSGSIPKDGPSSGIAQAIALISLFSGKTVPPTMAMTGEISLRGRITAVGGIKEKLIGALRAGVKTVLLPAQNRKDVRDLPQEVRDGLEILHVSHIWEAIRVVWPDERWRGEQQGLASVDTRL